MESIIYLKLKIYCCSIFIKESDETTHVKQNKKYLLFKLI
jgi:hypothetical protein